MHRNPLAPLRTLFGLLLCVCMGLWTPTAGAQGLLDRLGASSAPASPAPSSARVDHVRVQLLVSHDAVSPGATLLVGLQIDHDPQWHTYWRNPGDSGLPTSLRWSLVGVDGLAAQGEVLWPAPRRIPVGPLANFGYEDRVVLGQRLSLPTSIPGGQPLRLRLEARWLVCKDVCIPGEATLERGLKLAPSMGPPGADAPQLDQMLAALPSPATNGRGYWLDSASATLWVWGALPQARPGTLFVEPESLALPFAAQARWEGAGLWMLEVPLAESRSSAVEQLSRSRSLRAVYRPLAGQGAQTGYALSFSASAAKPEGLQRIDEGLNAQQEYDRLKGSRPPPGIGGSFPLATALVFALLGGLILNLMPCVFPVLGLKVLSLGGQAHAPKRARLQALLFLAGTVVTMLGLAGLLLALRAAGESVGWGFQLQNPWVIASLSLLFVAIAANLFGAFEFGQSLTRLGALDRGEGPWGALGSGALAVVVASPCTAPFMGSAIGYTATAGAAETLLVFTALAVGLAAPVSLLMVWPLALRWLPRPGEWMVRFRQLLAFPMLATAAWLAWVLAALSGLSALLQLLIAMVLLSLALWAYGLGGRWRLLALLSLGCLVLGYSVRPLPLATPVSGSLSAEPAQPLPSRTAATGPDWRPWAPDLPQRLATEGKVVFVDFTAAWCISCQANKARVLRTDPVASALAQPDAVALVADWTRQDPAISEALRSHGRNGVPLYLVYPKGGGAPQVLSEWLSSDEVMTALRTAGLTTRP